jgi:tetratricopeptide (TPR) repeat protein
MLEHKKGVFDKIARNVLLITVGLLPLFFIPGLGIAVEISKTYLLAIGVALGFVFWIIGRLVDGTLSIPKNIFIASSIVLVLVFFLSALFSPAPSVSFGGQALEVGTFASMLILVGFFILPMVIFRNAKQVTMAYFALFVGFIVSSLFQILYVFIGPKYLSLGTFFSSTSNLIGKWNDYAIFVGLIALLGLLTIELFQLNKIQKIILSGILVVSAFFLALVNFISVWIVLGVFALVVFIYTLSVRRLGEGENALKVFPLPSFLAVVICLLFILGNTLIGGFLSSKLGIFQTEVRPSVSSTAQIMKASMWKHPILGEGPNRFSEAWSLYHAQDVNSSLFWDTNFSSGFGLIPSFSVTTGILGVIAWLVFIVLFVWFGVKYALRFNGERSVNYSLVSTFVLSLYLWIFAIIYNPGIVPFSLAFGFSGMMIGLAISKGYIDELEVSFLKDPRHSFFSILALVVVLIALIGGMYVTVEKLAGTIAYARSSQVPNTPEGMDLADLRLSKAIALDANDTYYRNLALLSMVKLDTLVNKQDVSKETLKTQFQAFFGRATAAAQAAINLDRTNAQNWITIGQVYQAVVPLSIPGAYENAKQAYQEAKKRSPLNPGIELILARLDVDKKDTASARLHIEEALKLKPNYTEAVFLLSQIEVSEGNIAKAITRVENAATLDPNNSNLFFQLGLLKYNNKDWEGAVSAFERSVIINPSSLNTHYFLGLAYDKAGNTALALKQFKALATQVKDNESLNKIIANLEAGRPAIETVEPTPEKSKDLPVKEVKK